MKLLEYIHASLIMMLIIPFLYALAAYRDADGTVMLYIKCLLVIFPVIMTEMAVRKTKNPGFYLLTGLLVTGALWGLMHLLFADSSLCYRMVMPAESLLIVFIRFRERIRLARQAKEDDIYAAPQISFLNKPSLGFVWYFVAMYIIGICFYSKELCDIAFWNAAVYFFVALAHNYFTATDRYLDLNKRTKSIPKKRLYAVSAAMTGAFAGLVLMAMLPSFFLAGQRRYTDIRTWFDDVQTGPYAIEYQVQPDNNGFEADPIALLNEGEPAPEPSKLWEYFCRIFAAACFGGMLYGAFRMIRQVFGEFRNSFDENGDRVEELEEAVLDKEEGLGFKRYIRTDSVSERVRRQYRKTIRKHRKEIPAPYESPTELEKNAGLSENAIMKELHASYELVRYGRGE